MYFELYCSSKNNAQLSASIIQRNITTLKNNTVFSISQISAFQPSAVINYLQNNVSFLKKISIFWIFFAHAQENKGIPLK